MACGAFKNVISAAKDLLKFPKLPFYILRTKSIHILLFLFFLGGADLLFAQDQKELQERLQKLKDYGQEDTSKVRLLNDIAWDYSYLNYDSSKYFARLGAELATRLKFEDGLAEALNVSGNCSRVLQQFDSAFYFFERAKMIRQKQGNKRKLAGVMQNIANVYNGQRKYAEAIIRYKEALKYAEESKYTEAQLVILSNMIGVYELVGENDRALECGMRSLEINKIIKDSLQYGYIYSNIALILQKQNQVEKAIQYDMKALECVKNINDVALNASVYLNLGTLYKMKDPALSEKYLTKSIAFFSQIGDSIGIAMAYQNIGETFRLMRRTDEAFKKYEVALQIFTRAQDTTLLSAVLFSMADVLNDRGKHKEALLACNKALSYAKITMDFGRLKYGYKTLSEIYMSVGETKNAVYYHEKSYVLSDSLFSQQNADKNVFLQAEMYITAKENQIELLNKNNELKQTELSKQAVLRNF